MRYRLRTLLIVLAIGPPLLAWLVPPLMEMLSVRPPKVEMELLYAGDGMKRLTDWPQHGIFQGDIRWLEEEFQKAMLAARADTDQNGVVDESPSTP